ncbi:MAG: precorrin-6y C5,15-methyltransferase (decarboxylating) subunit CbiE [Nitrospirae bacterium]|nr:MAG: precorrin-6y C5,15-methyltransferase (decarboxylating) subunit CbiE [Nitrospirota bacterium]
MPKIFVIGIGYKPIDRSAEKVLAQAEVILASKRLLEVFERYDNYAAVSGRIKVINNVDATIEYIRDNFQKNRICLLASGDPLFFGIGRRVIREFGKDAAVIIPDISSMQIAFSKIGEAWDDAFLMSLHGGPDPAKRRRLEYEPSDIPGLLAGHRKIGILTDKQNNPAVIASELMKSGANDVFIHVCERLGYEDEKMISGTPDKIAAMSFAEPNVTVLIKTSGEKSPQTVSRLGLDENEFFHSRGLITKDEIRAATLHKLRLPGNGVFWDIGGGSGSVSIEAGRLCPALKIFTVEKDDEQTENISKNILRHSVTNIEIIHGEAPEALTELPAPNRVFIGGAGSGLRETIDLLSSRMTTGIIVINAVKLETLNEACSALQSSGFDVDVSQISVSRLKPLGSGNSFSALNPVFVIRGAR